ncbi:MAG: protoporphyrinogen oxidase [Alphaproteobacteria bacterium]|nr:protoporphyrinogen oxidase [Alphaproteobacteria bacterium]
MLEALRPRRKATTEESIYDFASRRFGREFADKVIEPMAAGLFMGDSRKLSINGAFSRLAEMEHAHGSIIRAILKARKGSQPGRHLYSWENGIGTIPAKLAKDLGPKLRTGVAVLGLGRIGHAFLVKTNRGTIRSRAVVLAVQPHVAAALLEPLDPLGAVAAGDIMAPPVNVVFLAYRREQVGHPLDGLGFLATKDPARIISGAQFQSTMYQGRAPTGHVAISAYAGGVRNPELSGLDTASLVAEIHQELAELLEIKGSPVLHRTRRWGLGLPQYELGHPARVELLETTMKRVPGLFVTGNFLRGVSVANCLGSATETAQRVAETLSDHSQSRGATSVSL